MTDLKFVVTGGPGSGKSTLISELSRRGITTMPEAGRSIIRHQTSIGGNALPWADQNAYANLMVSWDLRSYHEAAYFTRTVVFDRGLPDCIGYLKLIGQPVPAHFERAADRFRYNKHVFLAPFWEEIFTQDAERKQSPDEAKATSDVMMETYTAFGYQLIELPRVSPEERADFVLNYLSE